MRLQTLVRAVFPPECLVCRVRIDSDFAICSSCWQDVDFIFGLSCDLCGVALPGAEEREAQVLCDDCLCIARPWQAGRAVFSYTGQGRKLVLGLKHGDRSDVARAAGPWMARAAAELIEPDTVIVPVPLHWQRLAKRRYNQAALLAQALAAETGQPCLPEALVRTRRTETQDGRGRDQRFANIEGSIAPHPRHGQALQGKPVLLVDDVMTSGATFAAAALACKAAGSGSVRVMALARVDKDT